MLRSVSSSDPYTLPLRPHPWVEQRAMHDLFMEKSFQAQVADTRLPDLTPAKPLRADILAGTFQRPEFKALPKRFEGTREQLLDIATDIVNQTVSESDFNGLPPFLKLLEQLREGKTLREVRIDSRNESRGSTCIGMAHTILEKLAGHGIEGILAVQRRVPLGPFEHGAVVIECTNGFVLLDTRPNPANRIFPIPFGSTQQFKHCRITSAEPGSPIPLREGPFEYCTNIANGDHLVMTHLIMRSLDSFIPIAFYNPDGSARKSIKVCPSASEIVLFDYGTKTVETVSFAQIRNGELLPKLTAFMEPNYPYAVPAFHTPLETVHEQLLALASQENRLQQLLTQVE